ncbi:MAG: hypothetical protein ACYCT2_09250 [Thermoplasmataceae archaeon]
MKDRVPSGRGEFKPMETPPATVEVGRSMRKLGRRSHPLQTIYLTALSIVNLNVYLHRTFQLVEPKQVTEEYTDPRYIPQLMRPDQQVFL